VQLLAVEPEVQPALAQGLARIAILGRPHAAVPQQHLARAVLLLGNHAFELAVVQRMVLRLHREALVGRIEARPLGHRPALQHAFELQPEIVVQARRRVALDVVAQLLPRARGLPAARFRRKREVPHLAVPAEPIVHDLAHQQTASPPGNCYRN
jgi:hypothetical protein